jgi:hypothetical protein
MNWKGDSTDPGGVAGVLAMIATDPSERPRKRLAVE